MIINKFLCIRTSISGTAVRAGKARQARAAHAHHQTIIIDASRPSPSISCPAHAPVESLSCRALSPWCQCTGTDPGCQLVGDIRTERQERVYRDACAERFGLAARPLPSLPAGLCTLPACRSRTQSCNAALIEAHHNRKEATDPPRISPSLRPTTLQDRQT